MSRDYFVYFLTNKYNNVIYIGVTNDIIRRVSEHKNKILPGFSARYNLYKLVYYEITDDIMTAIEREREAI